MFTREFWLDTLERAVKSAAQAPLVVWAVGDQALNAFELDWQLGLGVAAGGALVSVLTSLGSIPIGARRSPSLTGR